MLIKSMEYDSIKRVDCYKLLEYPPN